MLEVSTEANEKLVEYMNENNITSSFRVFMTEGGCSGPSLALALDEEKDGDQVFTEEGTVFLVNKALLEQCGTIKLEFANVNDQPGFSLESKNPLPGAGGGCSPGSCGSTGCGC